MATVAVAYTGPTTITFSTASIATSATFVAGAESTQIDNTTNLFVDALVEGLETVGTTPTANTQIQVYVWGSHTSLATTARDVLDGTDSVETLTSAGIRDSFMKMAAVAVVDATTSDRGYPLGPFSVAALFGGTMPQFWGLFLTHNTGVNLNAIAGNHVWKYTGVKYTSA